MTRDDIIKMAKEAGIYHGFDSEGHWDGLLDFQLIERRPLSKESIIYGENRMFEILERFFHMAHEAGRQQGIKQERAMWELSQINQDIQKEANGNRSEVIEMAKEAGVSAADALAFGHYPFEIDQLEHFAALVAAAERNRTWTQDHWTEYERNIAAAEREACAKVCEKIVDRPAGYNGQWEGYGNTKTHMTGYECAAAIRARGQA